MEKKPLKFTFKQNSLVISHLEKKKNSICWRYTYMTRRQKQERGEWLGIVVGVPVGADGVWSQG